VACVNELRGPFLICIKFHAYILIRIEVTIFSDCIFKGVVMHFFSDVKYRVYIKEWCRFES